MLLIILASIGVPMMTKEGLWLMMAETDSRLQSTAHFTLTPDDSRYLINSCLRIPFCRTNTQLKFI